MIKDKKEEEKVEQGEWSCERSKDLYEKRRELRL